MGGHLLRYRTRSNPYCWIQNEVHLPECRFWCQDGSTIRFTHNRAWTGAPQAGKSLHFFLASRGVCGERDFPRLPAQKCVSPIRVSTMQYARLSGTTLTRDTFLSLFNLPSTLLVAFFFRLAMVCYSIELTVVVLYKMYSRLSIPKVER